MRKISLNKKGQVTIFIIVGILLVFGIVAYFLISNHARILERPVPAHVEPIQTNLKSCFDESTEESLFLVGLQGGKINLTDNYLETQTSKVSYAIKDSQNIFLIKQELENEVEKYIFNKITSCIERIKTSYPNYNISSLEIRPSVKMEDEKTIIYLSSPLIITREDSSYKLDREFKSEQKLRVGELHRITSEIAEQLSQDNSSMDLTYLTEQDYDIFITDYSNGNFLYTFTDLNNTLVEESYIWRFAVKI
jgi:hypothetical protein